MAWTTRAIGKVGEAAACAYLLYHGYRLWNRNWKVSSGELDLVASRNRELIFIEVKTRRSNRSDTLSACAAVNFRKQQKIKELCALYLECYAEKIKFQQICAIRYDVIGISRISCFRWRISHLKQAFE